tara:strand:- start:158 stop:361 length:204 start_codon:yes stop_codon:yes gene_type:complete
MKILLVSSVAYFFGMTASYAYIDPGTGSIILQAILAFIASVFTVASFYWNKIKLFLKSKFKKKEKDL